MSGAAKFLTIDGHRLAYREAGSGPPLLFLHGLGGNSASWQPQFDAFSDRYRVVAWDMPGFGQSELMPLATTRDYSTLARRFLDALSIARAVGVGTSYGTVILADLAAALPAWAISTHRSARGCGPCAAPNSKASASANSPSSATRLMSKAAAPRWWRGWSISQARRRPCAR